MSRPKPKTPSQKVLSHLKETIKYDPETGEFWRRAGSLHTLGYVNIGGHLGAGESREKYQVKAHRLAHFLMTGEWPADDVCIDHINRIRSDNRWSNLRACSFKENSWNRSARGEIPYRGVTRAPENKEKPFKATIGTFPNNEFLGYFATEQEAAQAFIEAARKRYGEFAGV